MEKEIETKELNDDEFLDSLLNDGETKKVEPEDPKKKIYGGFSKPYSDGIQASEDNEDIKTY